MAELSLPQRSAFTKQLATLLGAGIPLLQALDTLANGAASQPLQSVATMLKRSVSQGKSFQQALMQTQGFDDFYCQLVAAGEVSGTLDQVLVRLSAHASQHRVGLPGGGVHDCPLGHHRDVGLGCPCVSRHL
jgi:type II secretory pathway component PulF